MTKDNLYQIKKLLPKRSKNSNKTDGGKVLIIAGGKGLYGAGILSALACTRMGAGYTHLMTDLTKFPWLKFPDFILHPLKLSELRGKENFTIAIGPGLGTEKKKQSYLNFLLKNKFKNVVVDADALTLISQMKIKSLPESWILTPHEGELARLLGTTSQKIKADRKAALLLAHKKYGCTILLKGVETLIIDSEKKIHAVNEGTPALAKAGTGDVLLGMIAALRAQNLSAKDAAIVAAFIHGKASQVWLSKKKDHISMRPLDLIELFPDTIYKIRN